MHFLQHISDCHANQDQPRTLIPKPSGESERDYVISGLGATKQYRAVRRRELFARQLPNGFVFRDLLIIAPWRTDRIAASRDSLDFAEAAAVGRDQLDLTMRRKWDGIQLIKAGASILGWALQVETYRGKRHVRATVRGVNMLFNPVPTTFEILGPWMEGRTAGEQQLTAILHGFARGGVPEATAVAKSFPLVYTSPVADQSPPNISSGSARS